MSERVERALRELASAVREEVAAIPDVVGTLAEEIARARKESRLSLQEVGERSGFTKSHIWELEQGRSRNPTVGMIAGLSTALGVPFHRLAEAALNTLQAAREGNNAPGLLRGLRPDRQAYQAGDKREEGAGSNPVGATYHSPRRRKAPPA